MNQNVAERIQFPERARMQGCRPQRFVRSRPPAHRVRFPSTVYPDEIEKAVNAASAAQIERFRSCLSPTAPGYRLGEADIAGSIISITSGGGGAITPGASCIDSSGNAMLCPAEALRRDRLQWGRQALAALRGEPCREAQFLASDDSKRSRSSRKKYAHCIKNGFHPVVADPIGKKKHASARRHNASLLRGTEYHRQLNGGIEANP